MAVDLLSDVGERISETIGSVTETRLIEDVIAASKPAAIVSCAAFGAGDIGLMRSGEADSDQAFAVNVDGFRHLIAAADRHEVRRMVWTSSTVVYGPQSLYGAARVDETAAKAPQTIYGLTKHVAEEIAACLHGRCGPSLVGLRLPLVLGPGLWYRGAAAALIEMLQAARRSEPHTLCFHDAPIDLMHVADVAAAIVATLNAPAPSRTVYNINGFTARASDLVGEIRRQAPVGSLAHTVQPAAMLFPLISDARFRDEFRFLPRYDRSGFVASMLQPNQSGAHA